MLTTNENKLLQGNLDDEREINAFSTYLVEQLFGFYRGFGKGDHFFV